MKILIFGGTGTLGAHLVRKIKSRGNTPVVFSRDYGRQVLLACETIVGDVADEIDVYCAIKSVQPDVVIHAAANKHLTICEKNPSLCINTNILGSYNVLKFVSQMDIVKNFLFISSDKACNPKSVYGMSKYITECQVLEYSNKFPHKQFNSMRFGNLIGSTGSVLKIWQENIKLGYQNVLKLNGDGTDICKFMLLPAEAADFCLSTLSYPITGKVFIKKCWTVNIRNLLLALGSNNFVEERCLHYEKYKEELFSEEESKRISLIEGGFMLNQFVVNEVVDDCSDLIPLNVEETSQLVKIALEER